MIPLYYPLLSPLTCTLAGVEVTGAGELCFLDRRLGGSGGAASPLGGSDSEAGRPGRGGFGGGSPVSSTLSLLRE